MKIIRQWWLTFVLLALVVILLACQLDYLQLGNSAPPTATRRPTLSVTPTSVSDQGNLPSPLPTTAGGQPTVASVAPTVTAAPVNVTATATDNLRVRSTPSTSGAIIARLNKGESAQIVGRTAASDWWQIAVPSNPSQRGWVAAEFTTPSGPTTGVPVVGAGSTAPVPSNPTNPTVAPANPQPPAQPPVQPGPTRRPYPYP